MPAKLKIVGDQIVDQNGHQVFLRGINFAAEAKFPMRPGSDSFVDSPCTLDEADEHFRRLRSLGFNTLRYLYTWEALEHKGPGQYDEEYIDFTIAMVRKAIDYGFYVFMDPHQDVWSRFSGGSGAPKWTLEAVGFNCDAFEDTHSAMLYHKDEPKPVKMLWSSNYFRLVSQTMFTLFFAGEDFAPNCKINGVNIGKYLHTHYMKALNHFMMRFKEADVPVLGWESLNEPGHGYIGHEDLGQLSESPTCVKLTTAPTPFQGMLLGKGLEQIVEFYRFTSMGIRKDPSVKVAPTTSVWYDKNQLEAIDSKYNWRRSWYGCPWEFSGVYDGDQLLRPTYFAGKPTLDENLFIEKYFVQHWDQFYDMVSSISPQWMIFMQAPVNHPPPNLVGMNRPALPHDRIIYTPHYYDGLTLMLKRWMWMNVDSVGVCRNLYTNPVLALKVGPRAIKNGFQQQLTYIKKEGLDRVGQIPCLISEIGIPFDMDNRRAYTDGMFHDQILAMDANHHGLESALLPHALWVYSCSNTNQYGDLWCGEDLSIWSKDQVDPKISSEDPSNYYNGVRAAAAVIRPCPITTQGVLRSFAFDLYRAIFEIEIEASEKSTNRLYIPSYYYGESPTSVFISSGSYTLDNQVLTWTCDPGRQTLRIKGVPRFSDTVYYYADHLSKTFHLAKREFIGLFRRKNVS